MSDTNDRNSHDGTMLAMVLGEPHKPLRQVRVSIPVPDQHEPLIKLSVCGVCRTDLHIIDGDLPMHKSPLIIGHEVVGVITQTGSLVPHALGATAKGATVVCAGIHMSDIPGFPYALLWGERTVRSVANLTRADGDAFFALANQIDIKTSPVIFPLQKANDALLALRYGRFDGAAVLMP